MPDIRLELDYLKINRNRRRWNIYFIIATEDPLDSSKTLITASPESPVLLRSLDANHIDFETKGSGDPNGMFILERKLPEDQAIRVRLWAIQSREKLRNAGNVLEGLSNTLSNDNIQVKTINDALGTSKTWINAGVALTTLGAIVAKFLQDAKDKKLGFVSMDEGFTETEINEREIDRYNNISAFGEIGWTWVIG